jgi:ribosomal protein S18 acetylase RimI-like enzyme
LRYRSVTLSEEGQSTLSVAHEAPADLSEAVALRPVNDEDGAFLFKVYASARAAEMAATGWLEVQQKVFLNLQFKLQKASYADQFPEADHDIILLEGEPVGRMMVDRSRDDELRGVDIAILPEFRNARVGTFLIRGLLSEATATGRPFRIQVEKLNEKAIKLYERLNFRKTGETDTHVTMEWVAKG